MKILILYFSGTGNTEFIAQYIEKHLNCDMHEIELSPLELLAKETISEYDILIFGFPVYGFDIPVFIQEYLKDIPMTRTKSVVIFGTEALSRGNAITHAAQIFKKAGYTILGYADVKMPGSDGLAFVKKDSKMVSKISNRDFSKIEAADNMITRIKQVIKASEDGVVDQFYLNINSNIFVAFYSAILKKVFMLMEDWLKKKFWANQDCIKCLKCEKICPSKKYVLRKILKLMNK
ncbi:MAG: EFR1 family ferrodoxin [Acetobacterium sp.]